ncbi:Nif3-like dinuclear metal center hexameric protein [Fructilactobacillus frigidiflavus]|uniref:Nif3-like dinuclear metal center hexameric protein n=1 Tax=Fructilactobacillus frigidiflavus TaxID=3242688 RepID=UPI0037579A32
MTTINEFIKRFEQFAPIELRENGDPTGFQIGNKNAEIKKIMTTLDVRPETVQEAIDNGVNFIFTHHPVMFRPAKNLDLSNPQNQMYADILKHDITVYAAHTNLDNANGGMNDWLATAIGLENISGMILHDTNINHAAHYLGRVGDLPQAITFKELAQQCKKLFNLQGLRTVTNNPDKLVRRIAVLGGSGGKFYPDAIKAGADVYITGDLYYHTSQDMLAEGLMAIDPGHHVESICKLKLKELFEKWKGENDWQFEIIASEISTDPFTFL